MFYGFKIFYPDLYTEQQALEAKNSMGDKLWTLALDIVALNSSIYIIGNERKTVMFGNAQGTPLLHAEHTYNDEIRLRNYSTHFKRRGSDRYMVCSKNRTYLVRAVQEHMTGVIEAGEHCATGIITSLSEAFIHRLNELTSHANSLSNTSLNSSAMFDALQVVFGHMRPEDITQDALQHLRIKHAELQDRINKKKSYTQRLDDMFTGNKWIVYSYPVVGSYGRVPVVIHSATARYAVPIKVDFIDHPRLYPSLNAYYERNPEAATGLKAALMFTKLQHEKSGGEIKTIDTEGFIPAVSFAMYEDIGAFTGCPSSYSPTVTSPQTLIMSKA